MKYGAVIFVLLCISTACWSRTITLVVSNGWDEDRLTFDPSIISEHEVKKLAIFSPYTEEGIGGPSTSGRSNRAGVLDKIFLPPELEAYTNGGPPWRGDKLIEQNFYENARRNLEEGKRQLTALDRMRYPKELRPVVQYLRANFAFFLWLEETRFEFYQTWNTQVLGRKYEGFDPSRVCAGILQQIQAAASKEDKYNLARYQWHNCAVPCFRGRVGKYPIQSWKRFLATYKIKEQFVEEVPPD